jgi:spore germination protein GerM
MKGIMRTGLVLLLAVALIASLALSAGCAKKGTVSATNDTDGTDGANGSTEPTGAAKPDPANMAPAVEPDDDGSSLPVPAKPPETLTVSLYWISAGENALGVPRTIPYTKAVATAAMKALIAGPMDGEKTTWPAIGTAIPAGTKLLSLSIKDKVATVDLSGEFDDGGGSFAMLARLAQVVYTLEAFPTIDAVEFYLDGEKVKVFSSEGIELDGPQTLEDFSGAIPIDA